MAMIDESNILRLLLLHTELVVAKYSSYIIFVPVQQMPLVVGPTADAVALKFTLRMFFVNLAKPSCIVQWNSLLQMYIFI